MRADQQTRSLHYFNAYAVKDQVNCSNLGTTPPGGNFDCSDVLPTSEDLVALFDNGSVLLSRILVKYIPALHEYEAAIQRHISHSESEAMKRKSIVVSYY